MRFRSRVTNIGEGKLVHGFMSDGQIVVNFQSKDRTIVRKTISPSTFETSETESSDILADEIFELSDGTQLARAGQNTKLINVEE